MQYESLTAHLFDLDGTLIEGYMDRADKDFSVVNLLPNVLTKVKHLKWNTGNNIAIVTNQAGVAFGYNTEEDVQRKLCAVGAALEYGWIELHDGSAEPITLDTGARGELGRGVLQIYVCYEHPKAKLPQYQENYDAPTENRRKPSPNMIREAFEIGGYTQYCLMVGDRPEDEAAAKNAGVPFQWAKDFFNAS